MTDVKQLEARLENTEKALIGLWSLIQDNMPNYVQDGGDKMMEEYFTANVELGADFDLRTGFQND